MEQFVNNKFGDSKISKDLQKNTKDDLPVPKDFNRTYPCAQPDKQSTRPAIETAHPFEKKMSGLRVV